MKKGTLTRKKMKGFYERALKYEQDDYLPDGTVIFFNENNMKFVEPIFTPTLWNRIQHFFGHHFYTWYKKGCQYPNCKI